MTLLGGSVFLEASALLFQFYKTRILNVSVFWRPITLIFMLCICFSANKVLRNKMLRILAILYGIVAVSDLACYYLALVLVDWPKYARNLCERQALDTETTLEDCIKDFEKKKQQTDPDLTTSIIYSVTWLVFRGVIVFLLCALSNSKKQNKVDPQE